MRPLSPEEEALWAKVASTIRPLSRELLSSPRGGGEPPKAVEGVRSAPPRPLHHAAARRGPPPRAGEDFESATLDRTWERRIRSGTVEPDRTVDLHGMSLDGAWHAIDRALEHAIARSDRVILLITGHQRSGEPPVRRGAIRAAIHDWLAASRHAPNIAAVHGAHRRHGGGGSLYIVLRRRR